MRDDVGDSRCIGCCDRTAYAPGPAMAYTVGLEQIPTVSIDRRGSGNRFSTEQIGNELVTNADLIFAKPPLIMEFDCITLLRSPHVGPSGPTAYGAVPR